MPEPAGVELERALATLAGRLEYPPTPDIAPAVTSRLAAERRSGIRPPMPGVALWTRRRILVAVAVGLLALLAIGAAARLAIGAFELRVQPGVTPAPSTSPVDPDELGPATTLADAEARAGFRVALPPGPPPAEVHLARVGDGGSAIVLTWPAEPDAPSIGGEGWGLLVIAVRGDEEVALKTVGVSDAIEETSVDGRRALWVDVPHLIWFETDAGPRGPYRVTGNTLIWGTPEGVTYRIETSLPRAEAIALAESFS